MSNSGEETTGDTERNPKEPTSHTILENEFNSDIAKEPLRMEDLDAGSVGEMSRKSGRPLLDSNGSRQREDDSQEDSQRSKRSRRDDAPDASVSERTITTTMPVVGEDPSTHLSYVLWGMANKLTMPQLLEHMNPAMWEYYMYYYKGFKCQIPESLKGRELQDLSVREFKQLVELFSKPSSRSTSNARQALEDLMKTGWLKHFSNGPLTAPQMVSLVTSWSSFKNNRNISEADAKKTAKNWLKWMEDLPNKEASTMATMILDFVDDIPEPFQRNFHVALLTHVDKTMTLLEEIVNRGVTSLRTLDPAPFKPTGQKDARARDGVKGTSSKGSGKKICNGCGREGHLVGTKGDWTCRYLVNQHPDGNYNPAVAWKDSAKGKAWARRKKFFLPHTETLSGQPFAMPQHHGMTYLHTISNHTIMNIKGTSLKSGVSPINLSNSVDTYLPNRMIDTLVDTGSLSVNLVSKATANWLASKGGVVTKGKRVRVKSIYGSTIIDSEIGLIFTFLIIIKKKMNP